MVDIVALGVVSCLKLWLSIPLIIPSMIYTSMSSSSSRAGTVAHLRLQCQGTALPHTYCYESNVTFV